MKKRTDIEHPGNEEITKAHSNTTGFPIDFLGWGKLSKDAVEGAKDLSDAVKEVKKWDGPSEAELENRKAAARIRRGEY